MQVCRQQKGDIKCPGLVELIQQACRGKLDPQFGRIRNDQKENSFNRTYRVATIIGIGLTFDDHKMALPDWYENRLKDEPFVFKNVDGDGKEKWYGFSIDLLERMAEQIGFDYELIGLFCFHIKRTFCPVACKTSSKNISIMDPSWLVLMELKNGLV